MTRSGWTAGLRSQPSVLDYMAPAVMESSAREKYHRIQRRARENRRRPAPRKPQPGNPPHLSDPLRCRRDPPPAHSQILSLLPPRPRSTSPSLKSILAAKKLDPAVRLGETPQIMQASKLCLAVSGTATLETAYFRTPMVVVYRTNRWARHIAPRLLRVPHICLVNILAAREAVPESPEVRQRPAARRRSRPEISERSCRIEPVPPRSGRGDPIARPRRHLRTRRQGRARLPREQALIVNS